MLGAAGVAAGPFDDLAGATSGGAGIEHRDPDGEGSLARFDRATDSFNRPSEHRGLLPLTGRRGNMLTHFFSTSVVLVLVFAGPSLAYAAWAEGLSQASSQTMTDEPLQEDCDVPPLSSWTAPEQWAWKQICDGNSANFNESPLPDHRLGSLFLETILTRDPYLDAVGRHGVIIEGGNFHEGIDLSDAQIERPLYFRDSRFASEVNLNRLTTPTFISFHDSKFIEPFIMNAASIGGSLFLRESTFSKGVRIVGSKIGSQLSTLGSIFNGALVMQASSIGRNLMFLENTHVTDERPMAGFCYVEIVDLDVAGDFEIIDSTFNALDMSVSIGGNLFIEGSGFGQADECDERRGILAQNLEIESGTAIVKGTDVEGYFILQNSVSFAGDLVLSSVSVGRDLLLECGSQESKCNLKLGNVSLVNVRTGGTLGISGYTFTGSLQLYPVTVGGDLFLGHRGVPVYFCKPIDMRFIRIGSNLHVHGASLRNVDLEGARIDGDLRLGSSSEVQWNAHAPSPPCPRDNSSVPVGLKLRNATVGTLVDTESSWKNMVEWESEGFTYSFLGKLNETGESNFSVSESSSSYNRDDKWFIEWLEKDKSYSAQPYRQLASVLRAAGYDEKADDILFANRDRERSESGPSQFRWWLLTMLKYSTGYGYGLYHFRALPWFLMLVVLGTVVVVRGERSKRSKADGSLCRFYWNCFFYSLDVLLPGIELRKQHRVGEDLSERAYYCFYFLKLTGYILIFFVIAGLTGLTE